MYILCLCVTPPRIIQTFLISRIFCKLLIQNILNYCGKKLGCNLCYYSPLTPLFMTLLKIWDQHPLCFLQSSFVRFFWFRCLPYVRVGKGGGHNWKKYFIAGFHVLGHLECFKHFFLRLNRALMTPPLTGIFHYFFRGDSLSRSQVFTHSLTHSLTKVFWNINLKPYNHFTQYVPNICPIFAQYLPNIFPRFSKYLINNWPIFDQY